MSVRPISAWTYEDYLDLPDDGRRHEIADAVDLGSLLSPTGTDQGG